ncbi:glycosyltransferase family 4 protein [Enterobacteriaceae bacterium H11S18]|uniref:glycosyltransferase family 4 protein n=1 Tax=Dryocola clanedunensis TaxID=2925396 RepID=UPI0022F0040C|nr:glycosyltransferase family 4 protein [Dryocola clanedunensis]MCT4712316.1 glycosyltransferase family 4 protein [Dryocola clanedunensis]
MVDPVNKKKILVITPRFPYPVIGGDRLRIYELCKSLSEHYELTLISLCENHNELKFDVKDNVFKEIHRVYLSKIKSYFKTLLGLFSKKPLQVCYYDSREFKELIKSQLHYHDAVFCHLIRVADSVKGYSGVSIIEMTDAISLNYSRVRKLASKINFKALVYTFEQKRLEIYEKKMASRFDLVTFVSPVDRDYLYPKGNSNVKVFGNGVDTKHLNFVPRSINPNDTIELIFIGNMYSLQNMDAVLYFSKKILPEIKSEFNVKLNVLGKISEKDKQLLNSIDNVHALGQVSDINAAALMGHIGVCPVRLGAGIQNKVLEYMALGLPCITSSVGFEGLGAIDGKQILVADTINEYISTLDKLVNDSAYYNIIAGNARGFVISEFLWDKKLSPFVDAVDSVINQRP